MTIIQRSALVPYSQRQMFELVNGIAEYPRFLPWCSESQIISQSENVLEARLEIAWSGIHKSFTTRNTSNEFDRIDINLVTGPFRNLTGHWSFLSLAGQACKVGLDLEVEFRGGVVDKLFQPVFNHIANSLVEAFCKRAAEIYGK